ncbi:hypothetical protein TCAL_00974 [Tigriopus californicus]|uniref:Integrator complex subunit 7 n=1 Tax=Tigriopus californicus TaxID=6832 RepID=A0A553P7T3_TIGCA|nr:integrator complex subunit 7-like [Tigriopus californicus]TRY73744.1 hypothetical protein TCAL_00974 [Tigriopus californicus]|eukprot:TCALIF_00974-PA protein Name:"Similar to INTS7 Integrator complex subunit 7 (Gallus gallus)" AED:0.08 eAED:0.13 QI:0/0/0/1/1/1/6/0/1012
MDHHHPSVTMGLNPGTGPLIGHAGGPSGGHAWPGSGGAGTALHGTGTSGTGVGGAAGHAALIMGPSPAGALLGGDGDANSALAELDQGLRCGRLGEQSEAIVRFPRLFQKYPFPILINSALLKLADVFRQGSNFIKLCVLSVIQQSHRHLDKITNVDEFVKRIVTVLHSNDAMARALTLRTLGAIAEIIPERKQVHHSIRNALDSHDTVELQGAIFASGKFAAQSQMFATNMCEKISEMIRGHAMPLEMKLKLIPIYQHMHHDAQTACDVRETCVQMLDGYPSADFVCVTLHTLTLLSGRTLVAIPDQVELLLAYLRMDSRTSVKKRVLADLRFLASEDYAHLWSMDGSAENVLTVIQFASECESDDERCGALSILCDLIEHASIEMFSLENAESPVLRLAEKCCYGTNLFCVAYGTKLMTQIAINCKRELHYIDGVDVSSEAIMAIEALFLLLNTMKVKVSTTKVLKECMKCLVLLCQVHPEACDQFVDIVGDALAPDNQSMPLLSEVLVSLGHVKSGVLKPLLPQICHTIVTLSEEESSPNRDLVFNFLLTALCQTMKGHSWTPEAKTVLKDCMSNFEGWSAYRLARNLCRYGHFDQAQLIFKELAGLVSSEHFYFWLTGMEHVCEGEALLSDSENTDIVARITSGKSSILLGIASFTAATTQSKHHEFQVSYLKCRSEMLQALGQLLFSCHSLRAAPPPAIASSQAKQSHDDLQRCGRITQLLRKCVQDFLNVSKMFSELYQTSFDADPVTLIQLQLLQQINASISKWIEGICLKSSLQGTIFQDLSVEFNPNLDKSKNDYGIEIQDLINTCEKVATCFREISDPSIQPITNIHTDCLFQVIALLISSPLGLPRFFFQSLQQTHLKLAVTPQPRSSGEPVGVSTCQQFAIKVEGVIAAAHQTPKPFRTVEFVMISLHSTLVTANKSSGLEVRKVSECSQALEEKAVPHNDFFTAQFLVPFAVAGFHLVTIETQLVDSEGRSWRTGQKVTLNIKAFEDGHNRPSVRQGTR